MALDVKFHVFKFTLTATAGNTQNVPMPWLAKVFHFFSCDIDNGPTDWGIFLHGFDDGVTHLGAGYESAEPGLFPNAASSAWSDTASIIRTASQSLSLTDIVAAHVSAIAADHFTLSVTVNALNQSDVIYGIAFGGADLQYNLNQEAPAGTISTQTKTGLAFAPTALFAINQGGAGHPGQGGADSLPGFTFVTAQGAGSLCAAESDPASPVQNWRYQRATKGFTAINASGTVLRQATSVTLTSDGYSVVWEAANGVGRIAVLALAGVKVYSNVFNQPTTNSDLDISTPDLDPQCVLFGSVGKPTNASAQTGLSVAFGAAVTDLTDTQGAVWAGSKSGVTTPCTARYASDSYALAIGGVPTATGSSTPSVGRMVVSAFGSNLFTATFTDTDGTEPEIGFLALGPESAPPFLPDYEDPCAIKTPLRFAIITTPTHFTDNVADAWRYFRVAHSAWRDPSTRFGGKKSPRYQPGPVTHTASDWLTGQWRAATFGFSLIDTDYELRTFLGTLPASTSERLAGSLRGSTIGDYLTGNTHRLADGDPRLLYAGTIRTDDLAPNLVYAAEAYDPIGFGYNILSREKMVPGKDIESDFPTYGLTGTDTPTIDTLCAPIIANTHSDEGLSPAMGRIPQFYCGQITGLDTNDYHVGMVAGHACHELIEVRDQDGTAVTWGTNGYGPGKTGWAAVNPSGASLYTVINSRTYTICLYPVGSDLGDGFADGSVQLFTNVTGLTMNGDGTGGPITDLHDQLLWLIQNEALDTWATGDWLDTPTFDYGDGRQIQVFDDASIETAKTVAATSYLTSGFQGTWVLGLNGKQDELSAVLATVLVQAHVQLAKNKYQQYRVVMLDPNPTGLRTVTDVRDTLKSAPLKAGFQEQLLANNLRGAWGFNPRLGTYDVLGQAGVGQSLLSFGNKVAEPELFTRIGPDDTDTVEAVGLSRLAFRAGVRRLVTWPESLCGLRHQVLDVILMRHYNGLGPQGYVDRALWIQQQTINQDGQIDYEAFDVHDLMYSELAPGGGLLLSLSIEGTPPGVDYTAFFTATAHYSDGSTADVTNTATWSSDTPSVVTADLGGVIHGVSAGSAIITAVYQKTAVATLAIEIVSVTLTEVVVSGLAPTVGGTRQMKAVAIFDDGSHNDVTSLATWASTNTGVFTVNSATGLVTGVAAGTADVQATYP